MPARICRHLLRRSTNCIGPLAHTWRQSIIVVGKAAVPLGKDADGNETTAPVVVPFKLTPASLTADLGDGLTVKGMTGKAFEALRAVFDEDGGEMVPSGLPGFPEGGVVAVTRDAWR